MYVDIYIYVSRWVLRVFPSELVFLLFHNHFLILLNSFEVLTFYRMHFWNYSDFYSYIDMHVNMCKYVKHVERYFIIIASTNS